ncbi:VCBS repeat protein [Prosthecobacter fusiformis]|uniref:VCBS repeat protein n=2 Tax=Prosthecobacter fusiformis TaxID=48464 RepID=A0A4R7ST75_9BACT|nr:VCBS repeat protein [Prosthecobacter fusiformis]
MLRTVLALILCAATCHSQPSLPPGTRPLASAAKNGRGPLALDNLHHHLLGSSFVYNSKGADLFLAGSGGVQVMYLCRWVDTAENGAPVFAPPVPVKCPFIRGIVFQSADGLTHGLWIDKEEMIHTVFDREGLEFKETERLKLPKELKSPASIAMLPNADSSYDVAFEMSHEAKVYTGRNSTEEWRPFNSSGIANGELRYKYLFGAHLPSLLKGPLKDLKQITQTRQEVFFAMHRMTLVNLGQGHERDIITGSRQGILVHYHNQAETGFKLEKKRLCADPDGTALRHPSISTSVCAYPNAAGLSDLIAGGEGAIYYYRFTGKFTPDGAPVYADPVPALQEKADLYTGTLPSPTTVDWNGDDVLDIIVGNSEGFVLFFENIGSNEEPRFLPSTRIQAGGGDIQVQAGYSGSLQGIQEARWGYLSPNVVDWNQDGLPDIITGDITGDYLVYMNRGSKKQPQLEAAHPIYCDGIDIRGMWRARPAVGKIGARMALALVDGQDHFHLYWRIDDHNVEDGGKLLLTDGKPIGASGGIGGRSGRCKLDFFDWNEDGKLDFVIGTSRVNSIPDQKTGLPMPVIGEKTLGTPLLMLNTGTVDKPRFARPMPFRDENDAIVQPGGSHETGAVGTMLGKDGPNLLICNEVGRLFLLPGKKLITR